ncbi:MAG: glutathione S-transferase N-terminal domain-containing protein, partial [Pseudomonadota bacterium]
MKVLTSGPSPYGRKVKMTAMMKGLYDRITFEEVDVRPVENEELRPQNPLAKIPVLITDDGTAIYDSHVICEFLDAQVASPALFPGDGAERWQTLTRGALADGILDAALLMVYEKRCIEDPIGERTTRQRLPPL